MLAVEIVQFLLVVGSGVCAFYFGRFVGRKEGRQQGYVQGNNAAVDRLFPTGKDEPRNYPKSNVIPQHRETPKQTGGQWQ